MFSDLESAVSGVFVKLPSSEDEWKGISDGFYKQWNFPNCLGAIDGKHVVMQAPRGAGSTFFNYKGTHSIVILAVCNAYYRFILVDVGDAGRHSDGGVLSQSTFGQALESHSLPIPSSRALPGTNIEVPFVFVGDEAFPVRTNMLRSYPGRNLAERAAIFNYRLSRARRTIENSFGVLAARWRIFRRSIIGTPQNVMTFTKAAIVLHNFLRTNESSLQLVCWPKERYGDVSRAGRVLFGTDGRSGLLVSCYCVMILSLTRGNVTTCVQFVVLLSKPISMAFIARCALIGITPPVST